jgi:outer membrane lipoprotein-sorting protein
MRLLTVVFWVCVNGTGGLGARAETLKDVLARVDQAAASFRGMTAKITKASYTAVIKDLTEESGRIAMRVGKNREMEVRVDFQQPDIKTWAFRGRKAELFLPKINTVQEYDLGKHGRLLDQFLLLGFGSTSRDLEKNYTLSLAGEESLHGAKTSKLELIPKSAEARQHLMKVEIWFPQESGYPVQQKFYQGSGDYVLVSYSETRLESNIPDSAVRLVLPKAVKREFPQR